ncbi:hypothetical protein PGT21_033490 [Puccinia graminis f. sp. tritici]|uniref:Uncharacterized protein n=1 Tax=Puccinia graminis f. sp. tritici TaxID=56615 RepID=A0A5B0PK26_PUCGR|nr:hypothetical protein PGT21_033490 [Puccinia graminis f. sp. tritici]
MDSWCKINPKDFQTPDHPETTTTSTRSSSHLSTRRTLLFLPFPLLSVIGVIKSEKDSDLLDETLLAPPKNGNRISSKEWTPITTSGAHRSKKRTAKKAPNETEPVRYPEWTPAISTYLNKPDKTKRKPRKKKGKEMEETSRSNNNNESSNAENSRDERQSHRQNLEEETDLLDYSEEMTRDTSSVPPPPSGFASLGSSLPSITDTATRRQAAEASQSERGISPALINSRATSLALETMSNRSTPVPRPIDRLTFPVNMNTETGRQVLTPIPRQSHQTQFPVLEQPLAPQEEDTIMDNTELETVINLFNDQWNMFVQARENNNPRLMRVALIQAISSQEEIRLLAGGAEMLRISENWIAREELADLERSQLANQTQPASRLAITQTPHEHTVSPSPMPLRRSIRQPSYVTFLGTGPIQQGNNPMPPPPPPSTQPPSAIVRQNTAQQVLQHNQPTRPQYREGGYYQQPPHLETTVQNQAPQYQQQTGVVPNYAPQRPHRPPQQRNWRGSGRNWRRPQDQTSRLLEVGDYLMRAERIAGRVFRTRGRGRARGRGRGQPPRREEPPAQNHQ